MNNNSINETNEKMMSFWNHVYELRNRFIIVMCSVLIFSVAGYFIFPYVIKVIMNIAKENLFITYFAEGFSVKFRISIIIGVIFSIPIFFFEIIMFVFPALTKSQKRIIIISLISCFILFISGVLFAFKVVMPMTINFFKSKDLIPQNVNMIISYNKFIEFFFQFMLCFGLCFQFPVILLILLKIGIIKQSFLIKNFKIFIVVIFIISAILTPPDIISQCLMGVPMVLLYLICIFLAKIFKLGV